MNFLQIIGVILLELAAALFILWGFMYEEKLVKFENNVVEFFKNKIFKRH